MNAVKTLRPLILGIDPGLSGALAWLDWRAMVLENVLDMPCTINSANKAKQGKKGSNGGKKGLNVDAETLAIHIGIKANETAFAVVEEVHSMPNQGVASTFKFGYSAGILKGVLAAFSIPTFFIAPTTWKSLLNLSKDKSQSIALAKKHFPHHTQTFARAKDDGRAEAVLLALFGKQRFICTKSKA